MNCPACGTSLRLALVVHHGGDDVEGGPVGREAWDEAEQASLLREANNVHPAGSNLSRRRWSRAGRGGDVREDDER